MHRTCTCLFAVVLMSLAACAGPAERKDYGAFAARLLSLGHLRTDRAPADAPFSDAQLARNFAEIAFRYEFHFDRDRVVDRPVPKPLSRWQGPVRYRVTGDGVTDDDLAEIADLMAELSNLTGLDISRVPAGGNMLISIASHDGRARISRRLRQTGRHVFQARYDTWRQTPGWICGATLSAAPDDPHVITAAHVFLGAELSGTLRRACLHEEIVQSLGLTNDSPAARPSIFNDDQEFALLTAHDALLLRTLYHPDLRPGMEAEEAMPLVRHILSDLRAAMAGGQDGGATSLSRTGSRGARR